MKKTLTAQLEEANKLAEYYRGKFEVANDELYALKKRYDDKFAGQINGFTQAAQDTLNANQQLQEIIRWHINPETAKPKDVIGGLPNAGISLGRNY